MNAANRHKRQTFARRIGIAAMVMIIMHTLLLLAAAFFLLSRMTFTTWTATALVVLILGLASAIVFGIFLQSWITRILSMTLKRIVSVDKSVLSGQATFDARDSDPDSNEEISILYAHFSELANNFNTLQMDIASLTEQHLKGTHSAKINESKYSGPTQEVVKRLNAMADLCKDKVKG